jgi:hypothetical protein
VERLSRFDTTVFSGLQDLYRKLTENTVESFGKKNSFTLFYLDIFFFAVERLESRHLVLLCTGCLRDATIALSLVFGKS